MPRDETLYFLYAQPGKEELRLLTQYDIRTEVIPLRGVRMSVHTTGQGEETVIRWKDVTLRAETFVPDN
jgi:hypothetical protein